MTRDVLTDIVRIVRDKGPIGTGEIRDRLKSQGHEYSLRDTLAFCAQVGREGAIHQERVGNTPMWVIGEGKGE